ncbi:MAG: MFS transporter [Pirellulales bacterium]|nr:MFS transporter [Pirellulales bacterium]
MNQTDTNTPSTDPSAPKARFSRTFWTLNVIEMWERLAFFNLRVVAPIYIMQADNVGGLHLTATDKGFIYAWWSVFQCFLPLVTGGIADRFGYKRVMGFSVVMMVSGYLMMALLRDLPILDQAADYLAVGVSPLTYADVGTNWSANVIDGILHSIGGAFTGSGNFWGFFLGILILATGTAFFKPSIQGSLAHQLTKENSSVGWGIFYWVVNIGAFVGHFLPSLFLLQSVAFPGCFHGEENSAEAWRNLFLASALFSSVNLLVMLTFRDVPSGASKTENIFQVLKRTLLNILEIRLFLWMVIMSCFWMMMYQLWDTQPNFITDWVDSGPIAKRLDWLPKSLYDSWVEQTPRGPMIPQNILISFNAIFIIIGVVGVSWLNRKMRTLTAMLIGMVLATAGLVIAGWTQSVWILIFGILFFSLGEMMTGPKKSEYLALIAPPGKKGLYLGYLNVPVGVGLFVGSQIAGWVYGNYGEKANLALRYLAEKTPFGVGKNWDGNMAMLEQTLGVSRTKAMIKLQEVTGMDAVEATQMLWNTYSPHYIWIPFALIGVVAAIGLLIFGQLAKRWSDMNA